MRHHLFFVTLCIFFVTAAIFCISVFVPKPSHFSDQVQTSETSPEPAEGPSYEVLNTRDITFTESLRVLDNPERGFYTPAYIFDSTSELSSHFNETKLVHLRINLGQFSHEFLKHTGRTPAGYTFQGWDPLSEEFLATVCDAMDAIRRSGCTAVVRFAYDNFEGISDMEPEMQGILSHIEQLRPFFEAYEDVIFALESGFVGQYGEQHSSLILTPSYSKQSSDTIHTLVQALLDAVPSSISVTVRRPTYAAYACGMTIDELKHTDFSEHNPYYRVGVYNDGMFGSEDDLGTYQDRSSEIKWLYSQAAHTAFGGETNYNHSTDGTDYTDGNLVCQEMFWTHLTYLNGTWPEETIDSWKNTTYQGNDPLYAGQSTYFFIANHLGYRYVLRSFDFQDGALQFQIENVGAGNMLKEKRTTLVLVSENGHVTEIPTEIDVRSWHSQTTSSESVKLDIGDGIYQVYLKIADANGNQVQLANDNLFTENGNLIGAVSLRSK